jgi:hypothetical protein
MVAIVRNEVYRMRENAGGSDYAICDIFTSCASLILCRQLDLREVFRSSQEDVMAAIKWMLDRVM